MVEPVRHILDWLRALPAGDYLLARKIRIRVYPLHHVTRIAVSFFARLDSADRHLFAELLRASSAEMKVANVAPIVLLHVGNHLAAHIAAKD